VCICHWIDIGTANRQKKKETDDDFFSQNRGALNRMKQLRDHEWYSEYFHIYTRVCYQIRMCYITPLEIWRNSYSVFFFLVSLIFFPFASFPFLFSIFLPFFSFFLSFFSFFLPFFSFFLPFFPFLFDGRGREAGGGSWVRCLLI